MTNRKPAPYSPGWSGTTRNGRNAGKYTAEKCPREGCEGTLVHNGNVYCENWAYHGRDLNDKVLPVNYDRGECDWALPHPQDTLTDRLVSYRTGGYWELGEFWDQQGGLRYLTFNEEPVAGGKGDPAHDSVLVPKGWTPA